MDHLDRDLEGCDGLLYVAAIVSIVAIDLAQLLKNETSGSLHIDNLRIFIVLYLIWRELTAQSLDFLFE